MFLEKQARTHRPEGEGKSAGEQYKEGVISYPEDTAIMAGNDHLLN